MIPMPQQPQIAQAKPDDNAWEAIMAELGLSPEDFAALVEGTAAFPEESAMVGQEMAPPQMRQAGRVNVASNPLEFLASGLARHKMGGMIDALRKGRGVGMKVGAMDRMSGRTGDPADLKPDPYGEDELSIPELLRRPSWQG